MVQIEIDFEVYKAITVLRKNERDTENNVLRRLLKLKDTQPIASGETQSGLISRGTLLPNGMRLKRIYKGKEYNAIVKNNFIVFEGKNYTSPSSAAVAITNSEVNGWRFWRYQLPNQLDWKVLDNLRT